ncbi:hypothetical protein [Pseudooceanicola atlanticus]|uniref:hypothetical protein n=1 Tax=Pseudooceanicola atlanticus TaxID=1461694 RepID=UPI002352F4FF|nr:hypothetical protein [Pseudooceanicola atlanticus]
MEYISGQGKVVSGFEGAWYYEDGAVQPLGDLISVIDDLLDASAVEDALRAPLEVPISEYEKQKNSGPAELKIEFSVVDQF